MVTELNERYAPPEQQLVRARSIRAIVQYARLLKGNDYVDRTLGDLQVSSDYFASPDSFVSPVFGDDLLSNLVLDGFSDFQVRQMGAMTLITNQSSTLRDILSSKQSPRQLYEDIHVKHVHLFDQIWNYRLMRLSDDGCTIEITLRENSMDTFRVKSIGSQRMCLFRQGVYMAFAGNIRSRFAQLVESECMYKGARRCMYHVKWE